MDALPPGGGRRPAGRRWRLSAPGTLRPRARTSAVGALALVLLAGGCGGEDAPATTLEPERYVDVMARLALVDTAMTTSVQVGPLDIAPDSARRLILDRWSVTGDQLVAFARTVGRNPARMQELWDRIMATADSLREAGWTPGGDADGEG